VSPLDKPNVTIPLAMSYNTRGFAAAAANAMTNAIDQRKINCVYEPIANQATGKKTLYLAKRPGLSKLSSDFGLSASDKAWLVTDFKLPSTGPFVWIFFTNGTTQSASNGSSHPTIVTASLQPIYVTKTSLSGLGYVVVQYVNSSGVQRVFFAAMSDITTWTEITDSDFSASTAVGMMAHRDGFAHILGTDNKIRSSDLNSLSAWSATSFISRAVVEDQACGLIQHDRITLAFGAETVEGFQNAGNTTGSPLSRNGITARIGLGGPHVSSGAGYATGTRHYSAALGSRTYFIGAEAGRDYEASLYAFNGQTFENVSTPAIRKILSAGPTAGTEPYHVSAFSFYGQDAIGIALDVPTATTQRWLVFNPSWNEWFEWQSTEVQPVCSGGYFIGAHNGNGPRKLHRFQNDGTEKWVDGASTAYTMTAQFKLPKGDNARQRMPWCGVVGDSASSASSVVGVSFSDDDYPTFSTARDIDMSQRKKHIYRCGSYRDRAVRLTHSHASACRLEKFIARIE